MKPCLPARIRSQRVNPNAYSPSRKPAALPHPHTTSVSYSPTHRHSSVTAQCTCAISTGTWSSSALNANIDAAERIRSGCPYSYAGAHGLDLASRAYRERHQTRRRSKLDPRTLLLHAPLRPTPNVSPSIHTVPPCAYCESSNVHRDEAECSPHTHAHRSFVPAHLLFPAPYPLRSRRLLVPSPSVAGVVASPSPHRLRRHVHRHPMRLRPPMHRRARGDTALSHDAPAPAPPSLGYGAASFECAAGSPVRAGNGSGARSESSRVRAGNDGGARAKAFLGRQSHPTLSGFVHALVPHFSSQSSPPPSPPARAATHLAFVPHTRSWVEQLPGTVCADSRPLDANSVRVRKPLPCVECSCTRTAATQYVPGRPGRGSWRSALLEIRAAVHSRAVSPLLYILEWHPLSPTTFSAPILVPIYAAFRYLFL
ncbi:hypothetical protein B0H16DRAFT_1727803 [Mycena metata]|uniref:Uncharacterized protein n=1 Tax=Mycena metata TaxID=1033252 RepID=A0AAD7N326_9AGAR|nr:hypothetical protein B0H16DRAFT_1727803 [Mycena metata]